MGEMRSSRNSTSSNRQNARFRYRGNMIRHGESYMTPRLRAESDGVIETLEGMRRAASETSESCLLPISKNSVLD